jgi:hypothetical protein
MERAYTVQEIDNLRRACEMRWLYGTTKLSPGGGFSRCYREEEKSNGVENLVRTYMIAGKTAQDIRDADNEVPNGAELSGIAADRRHDHDG